MLEIQKMYVPLLVFSVLALSVSNPRNKSNKYKVKVAKTRISTKWACHMKIVSVRSCPPLHYPILPPRYMHASSRHADIEWIVNDTQRFTAWNSSIVWAPCDYHFFFYTLTASTARPQKRWWWMGCGLWLWRATYERSLWKMQTAWL